MSCSGRLIRLAGRRAILMRQRSAEVPLQPPLSPAKPTVLALGPAYTTTRRLSPAAADQMLGVLAAVGPPSRQSLLEAATITAKCIINGHFVRTGRFLTFAELRSALQAGSTGGSAVLQDSAAAVALLQATGTDAQQLVLSASQIIKVLPSAEPMPSNVAIGPPAASVRLPQCAAPALALPATAGPLPAPIPSGSIGRQQQHMSSASLVSDHGRVHALQTAETSHMGPPAVSGCIALAPGFVSAAQTSSDPASIAALALAPQASAASAGLTAETGGMFSNQPGGTFFSLPHLGQIESLPRAQEGSSSHTSARNLEPQATNRRAGGEGDAHQLHLMVAMAVLLSLGCTMLVTRMHRQMEERLSRAEAAAEYWYAQLMMEQDDAVERAMAIWAAQHDVELQAASRELLSELRSNR